VQLVPGNREAAGEEGASLTARPVISCRQRCDCISRRVVTEDTTGRTDDLGCVTAQAVDLRGAADGEYAASHVVHLVIRVGSDLGGPSVGGRVVLERVGEVGPRDVSASPSDGIEASVRREVVARSSHGANGWHVRTGRPAGDATWSWARRWCSLGWCRARRAGGDANVVQMPVSGTVAECE